MDPFSLFLLPLVYPEELWRESGQLQRTAEETGDAAAGWYCVKHLQAQQHEDAC